MKIYWPTWLGFFAGVAVVIIGLLTGADLHEKWQLATRYTAQVSFPFFLITFVASALVRLFPNAWTRAIMRDRRWWGLGFAACFLTHLVALLVYNWLEGRFPPAGFLDRGVWAYAVLLAMILTSTNAARRRLGRGWTILHRIGMWGFLVIFALTPYLDDFLTLKMPDDNPLVDPYTLSCLAAIALKAAARVKSRWKRRRLAS